MSFTTALNGQSVLTELSSNLSSINIYLVRFFSPNFNMRGTLLLLLSDSKMSPTSPKLRGTLTASPPRSIRNCPQGLTTTCANTCDFSGVDCTMPTCAWSSPEPPRGHPRRPHIAQADGDTPCATPEHQGSSPRTPHPLVPALVNFSGVDRTLPTCAWSSPDPCQLCSGQVTVFNVVP